jgi:hypothetical protein
VIASSGLRKQLARHLIRQLAGGTIIGAGARKKFRKSHRNSTNLCGDELGSCAAKEFIADAAEAT